MDGKVFDVPIVLLETCFLRIALFTAITSVTQVVYSFVHRSQMKVSLCENA